MKHNFPAFSAEEVNKNKALYPGVCKILNIWPDEDTTEPVQYLIRKPSKALVYMLSDKEFDGNVEKSSDALISNCVLAGDAELLEQDASVFTELVERIGSLTKSARSDLKKA